MGESLLRVLSWRGSNLLLYLQHSVAVTPQKSAEKKQNKINTNTIKIILCKIRLSNDVVSFMFTFRDRIIPLLKLEILD